MKHIKLYEDFLNEALTKYGEYGILLFKDLSTAKRYEEIVNAGILDAGYASANDVKYDSLNEGLTFNSMAGMRPEDAWKKAWEESFGSWFESRGAKVIELVERQGNKTAIVQSYHIYADDVVNSVGSFFTRREAEAAKTFLEKNCIGRTNWKSSGTTADLNPVGFTLKEHVSMITISELYKFEKAGAKIDVDAYNKRAFQSLKLGDALEFEAQATAANMGARKPTKAESEFLSRELDNTSYFSTLYRAVTQKLPIGPSQIFNYFLYEAAQDEPTLVAWSGDGNYAPRQDFWIALQASSGLIVPVRCLVNTTGQKVDGIIDWEWLRFHAPAGTADRVIDTYRKDAGGQAAEVRTLVSRYNRLLKML